MTRDVQPIQGSVMPSGGGQSDVPRLWVDTQMGGMNIMLNKEHPSFVPEKARAALSEMNLAYCSSDNGHDTTFWGNSNRRKPEMMEQAAGILAKHGFLTEAEKPEFIKNTRQGMLKGYTGLLLEASDGILSDYASSTKPAKPFIELMTTLAMSGDVATLPHERLIAMRAIANKDQPALEQLVPSFKWQPDFRELCENWKPEVEAAIRHLDSEVLETDAQGKPLVRSAPASASKGQLR